MCAYIAFATTKKFRVSGWLKRRSVKASDPKNGASGWGVRGAVFFSYFKSSHNGVENSVENVQNPDEKGIELGDGQVMRNFTQ